MSKASTARDPVDRLLGAMQDAGRVVVQWYFHDGKRGEALMNWPRARKGVEDAMEKLGAALLGRPSVTVRDIEDLHGDVEAHLRYGDRLGPASFAVRSKRTRWDKDLGGPVLRLNMVGADDATCRSKFDIYGFLDADMKLRQRVERLRPLLAGASVARDAQEPAQRPKKRGRPRKDRPRVESRRHKRIMAAWRSGTYRTYAECADALTGEDDGEFKELDVKQTVDREAARQRRKKNRTSG